MSRPEFGALNLQRVPVQHPEIILLHTCGQVKSHKGSPRCEKQNSTKKNYLQISYESIPFLSSSFFVNINLHSRSFCFRVLKNVSNKM